MNEEKAKKLFEDNIRLAYWIMSQRFPHLIDDDDVRQEALLGLYKACLVYDESRGSLSSVAYKTVVNQVLMHLRRENHQRHVSTVSMDTSIINREGEEVSLSEFIVDPTQDIESNLTINLDEFVGTLNKREKLILHLRDCGLGQKKASNYMGISQSYYSRLLKKIRKKFREWRENN